ncbi:MAG: FAD-dependent oxidoreductase [Actinomycetia bacterium]|nr:FAD-dependent oxidoreductase [Actinomycetes bacterium]
MAVDDVDTPEIDTGESSEPKVTQGTVSAATTDQAGVAGFVGAWKSLATGLGITAKHAFTKPVTIQYPREKAPMPERWRGAPRLVSAMGTTEVPLMEASSLEYNGLIADAYATDHLAPCQGNCPANVDARGQNYHAAEGRWVEAYQLVRERNIMPGTLGRICHHPCETACKRNFYDEPIAIRPLHRVAYEQWNPVKAQYVKPLPKTRGKKVAIIGSGPSGLAAAYDLVKLGYEVKIFEKEDKPGGALYYGIPAYRLPRDILHGEIDDLVTMGVEIQCSTKIGVDISPEQLMADYDAIIIAAGLQISRFPGVKGQDAIGVRGALDFLKDSNYRGEAGVRGQNVLVIGGGNVAVDAARCALRVGAKTVYMASLESDEQLPAHPWEVEEALDEGVVMMCGNGPNEVLVDESNHVRGMRLQTCLSVFDETGRFNPTFGDDFTELSVQSVVMAIGQGSDLKDIVAGTGLELDQRGNLPSDRSVFTTAVPKIFASGECVTGPGSAIASIATGHEAATSVHRFLSGESVSDDRVARTLLAYDKYAPANLDHVEPSRLRAVMPFSDPDERSKDFRNVELGLTVEEGLAEGARCLRCETNICVGCTFCARTCPDYCITVERRDDPGDRMVTKYDLDLSKCCFCGLCAEQCPTGALQMSGQYELSFYNRDLTLFDKGEMLRDVSGTRATGADAAADHASKGETT